MTLYNLPSHLYKPKSKYPPPQKPKNNIPVVIDRNKPHPDPPKVKPFSIKCAQNRIVLPAPQAVHCRHTVGTRHTHPLQKQVRRRQTDGTRLVSAKDVSKGLCSLCCCINGGVG